MLDTLETKSQTIEMPEPAQFHTQKSNPEKFAFKSAYADFCNAIAEMAALDDCETIETAEIGSKYDTLYFGWMEKRSDAALKMVKSPVRNASEFKNKLNAAFQICNFANGMEIEWGALHTQMLMSICIDAQQFDIKDKE